MENEYTAEREKNVFQQIRAMANSSDCHPQK